MLDSSVSNAGERSKRAWSLSEQHAPRNHAIRKLLEKKNYTCYEEVYGIDDDGSTSYADIIAFSKDSRVACIVDPTVRYENNDPEQAEKVDTEERKIYEKCKHFYKEKYREEFGGREFRVRGLWFGSRGTKPKLTIDYFSEVGINDSHIYNISEDIIIDSLAILNFHIYA